MGPNVPGCLKPVVVGAAGRVKGVGATACWRQGAVRPVLVTSQKDVACYLAKTRNDEYRQGGYWRDIW